MITVTNEITEEQFNIAKSDGIFEAGIYSNAQIMHQTMYGAEGHRVYEKGGKYYAEYRRYESCD